jgi:hypothetical protein
MRLISSAVFSALSLMAVCSVSAYAADKEVAVEPAAVTPGQTITLRWYFTGTKVVVSGGRFGKGVVVTGRTSITDQPRQTTTYSFDVWYSGQAPGPNGAVVIKPLHAHYTVIAQVESVSPVTLSVYRDPRGWQVGYMKGWKLDKVDLPDPANNGLIYFQQEDDAVERLAVSMVPAENMTTEQLMEKVHKSLFGNYDEVQVVSKTETKLGDIPAIVSSFTGKDQSHPGLKTQSILMGFIRNGHAYVVSARTPAAKFALRRPALEKMVRSFAFNAKSASK